MASYNPIQKISLSSCKLTAQIHIKQFVAWSMEDNDCFFKV